MTIIGLLITAFLEQQRLLSTSRSIVNGWIIKYLNLFVKDKNFSNQRAIRYAYLFACVPFVCIMVLIKIGLFKLQVIYLIYMMIIFMLSVYILAWRKHKTLTSSNSNQFIQGINSPSDAINADTINAFATEFFAPLFWFAILPAGIGVACYILISRLSMELKNKGVDLIVYNVVVDRMLFYANIIPYIVLFVFIAIAGNFDAVFRLLISKRKSFTKSFYFLQRLLEESILLAINKKDFQINRHNHDNINDTESGIIESERFTPKIRVHINALLYRTAIFFIGIIFIISIVHFMSF